MPDFREVQVEKYGQNWKTVIFPGKLGAIVPILPWMFSILNRVLSGTITSFGNKFCLEKRSRLIKALDNRFYVKFMQLGIGLLSLSNMDRTGLLIPLLFHL